MKIIKRPLEQSKADGVMIGRGCYGKLDFQDLNNELGKNNKLGN